MALLPDYDECTTKHEPDLILTTKNRHINHPDFGFLQI